MTLEDRNQARRLQVFRRAEELGNVTAACREAGAGSFLGYLSVLWHGLRFEAATLVGALEHVADPVQLFAGLR